MKKKIYQVVIVILVTLIGFTVYQSNSQEEVEKKVIKKEQTLISKKKEDNSNKLVNYKPKQIDSTSLDEKIKQLEATLSKTKELIKEHNKTNKEKILTNEDPKKLLSPNINITNNTNQETNTLLSSNKELQKLQKEIENTRETISNLKR